VSAWMAGFNALAQIFAFVGFGLAIDTFMEGGNVFGFHIPDGFKLAAVAGAVFTLLGFLPCMLKVKETPHAEDKEVPYGLLEAGWQTLKNPAFLPYIISGSMLYAAQFMITAALPFLVVTKVVDDPKSGDLIASFILLGLVVMTMLMFPFAEAVSRRFKKTQLYIASLASFAVLIPLATLAGSIPGIPAMAHLVVIMALIAPGLAVGLVIPRAILADVMDHDTKRTGYRREAMYNGMEGLIQKIAGGLAPLLQGFLFSAYGFSRDQSLGIVLTGAAAGVLSLIGLIAFLKYPLKG
jgi:GPH family glycoside/pentoside/hexuronide:cation symporter